ncbi:hypothetical protein LXL04_035062 [Taraxacum kok-saghyz]
MAPLQRSTAPTSQADQLQIQHFTHQHPVHKLFMAMEFNCDGCKTRGHGVRYRCSACNYDLHEHCATAPHRLSSHVHPHHQIVLVNRPGTSHFCDVCKGFTDGLSYTCQTCEFDVHTLCTQIPVATGVPQQGGVSWVQSTTAFGGQQMVINHQQQGVVPTMTVFGDYHGANNSKPIHQYYQQQQGIPTTAFAGGYQKVNNNQAVMMNHYQQQQGIPMTAFGGYQNQVGGYNQNQPAMMNQQPQQQGKSNNLANVGKFAANILMTSLIGVPLNFNSRK